MNHTIKEAYIANYIMNDSGFNHTSFTQQSPKIEMYGNLLIHGWSFSYTEILFFILFFLIIGYLVIDHIEREMEKTR